MALILKRIIRTNGLSGACRSRPPDDDDPDLLTWGGLSQEDVEDRHFVSTVKPQDYPEADRADSKP